MLTGEKILVTGPTGNVGVGLIRHLIPGNEVWGMARFTDKEEKAKLEELGVKTIVKDFNDPQFDDIDDDFTIVLNLAAFYGGGLDYDFSIRINAEAPAALMYQCRKAKAFLHVSSVCVYDINDDPRHAFKEDEPLGDSRQPYSPTYAVGKIASEAAVRSMARILNLPTIILRLGVGYDDFGGLPTWQLDWIKAGEPVPVTPGADVCFSPIHHDDMAAHIPALVAAASVPATITNWGGDETVGLREWCEYIGELVGKPPIFKDSLPGICGRAADPTKRLSITGPCRIGWREGMKRMVLARENMSSAFSSAWKENFITFGGTVEASEGLRKE